MIVLLLPIGGALLFSGIKSIWVTRRNKREILSIYNFLLNVDADDKAFTNDEISKATGVPKDRVIGHCADHDGIEDAGKRQRSWKIKKEGTDVE